MSWSHKWGLCIDPVKTKALIITNKHANNPPPLSLGDSPLNYVQSCKFLGLVFDSRLTWRIQIENLKHRCRKDLRLMRIVAGHPWGADLTTLRRLYCSLVRPKIDYGSFLYGTAAISNLVQIDRIQYEASRTILGALRCTSTYKLEAEANLMSLRVRRNQLLMQYACRVTTIPEHPVSELIETHTNLQNILLGSYTHSAIDSLEIESSNLHFQLSTMPRILINQRYCVELAPVNFSH